MSDESPPVGPPQQAYIVHDEEGRILAVGTADPAAVAAYAAATVNVVLTSNLADARVHYFAGGNVIERPEVTPFDKLTITADGQDTAAAMLPIDAIVYIDGVANVVPEGPVFFVADTPGTYRVEIKGFPLRDYVAEITAQ